MYCKAAVQPDHQLVASIKSAHPSGVPFASETSSSATFRGKEFCKHDPSLFAINVLDFVPGVITWRRKLLDFRGNDSAQRNVRESLIFTVEVC